LRFGNDVQIDSLIEANAEEGSLTIEPMLLIPFVENAFKHSVGTREQPKIGIHLSAKEGWMQFEVRNTFDETVTAGKEENSGLGLNNVRTRLGLLYPKNHTLTIRKEGNWFHIVLTLKLI
jgi:sensor histidine kinase YesM